MKRRILVVEDDEHLADGIAINLKLEGYDPVVVDEGEAALQFWRRGGFDLILLDVMLPGISGFELCRTIRQAGDRVPVLFLTARGRDEDRIRGLEEGGDDYLTKPFNLQELLARIKGIFRRQEWYSEQPITGELVIGEHRIDLRTYEVTSPGGHSELKEKEVMILRLLAEKGGEPVDRSTIINRVWGYDAYPTTRTVDNFVLSLRKKLEKDPSAPEHLLTVHGVGYRLVT